MCVFGEFGVVERRRGRRKRVCGVSGFGGLYFVIVCGDVDWEKV